VKLYLDDNFNDPILVDLLQKAGHTVVCPQDVGSTGNSDPQHLEQSIRQQLVMLTQDAKDFRDLHNLVLTCCGEHTGIIVVLYDNNPKHNMEPKHILRALAKLERSGFVIPNFFIELNHWR